MEEAARTLGLRVRRVQVLCQTRRLPWVRVNRTYLIDRAALARFARVPRPPGRRLTTAPSRAA